MSQPLPFSSLPCCSKRVSKKAFRELFRPIRALVLPRTFIGAAEGSGHLAALYNTGDMAVRVEMQNTGDPQVRGEIVAIIEHVLSDRAGEWRVSIVGSHANDNWKMTVEGPTGFERSYTLVGGAGEHEPAAIGSLVVKLLPATRKP